MQQYVLVIYQGTTPLPTNPDAWAALTSLRTPRVVPVRHALGHPGWERWIKPAHVDGRWSGEPTPPISRASRSLLIERLLSHLLSHHEQPFWSVER